MSSVKILSFDIGMRHLAFCYVEKRKECKKISILQWDVIDLYEHDCGEKEVDLLARLLSLSSVKKRDFPEMKGSLAEIKKTIEEKITKELKEFQVHQKDSMSSIDMISCKMKSFLNSHPEFLDSDIIALENQPVLTNPVMKSVQMVLYAYFVYHMKGSSFFNMGRISEKTEKTYFRVKLIAAGNKNKLGDEKTTPKKKMTYKERKEYGIQQTRKYYDKIVSENGIPWMTTFENHKKKDDLADSFLQSLVVAKEYLHIEV
jgi:predicted RNA-binding protein Jag